MPLCTAAVAPPAWAARAPPSPSCFRMRHPTSTSCACAGCGLLAMPSRCVLNGINLPTFLLPHESSFTDLLHLRRVQPSSVFVRCSQPPGPFDVDFCDSAGCAW